MLSFRHAKQTSKNVADTTFNDLPDDVIYNIAIYADDTTLYSKCNWASDLWQQLELASELESDLQDTVDWGKKWKKLIKANALKVVDLLVGSCICI